MLLSKGANVLCLETTMVVGRKKNNDKSSDY